MPPSQPEVGLPLSTLMVPARRRAHAWLGDTSGVSQWYDESLEGLTKAFNTGDFSLLENWIADDAVFDWSRSISDASGVHHGRETMRSVFYDFIETWDTVQWEITRVDELGPDTVLASTCVRTRVRDSENEIEANGAQLLEFRDGKIVRVTLFQGRDDALAAVDKRAER
jgi:ketosteroid isomerase-like protein